MFRAIRTTRFDYQGVFMPNWESILIVDDEKNTREGLGKFLESLDYDVFLAESASEAIEIVKKENPDVVLSDIRMPDTDGITLLHQINEISPQIPVILLTAYGSVENAVQAMKAGAFHYLTKPVNLDELEFMIKKALSSKKLRQENQELRKELIQEKYQDQTIISSSPKMKNTLDMASKVAQSDSSVLLQGETGTGKELVAHHIHNQSERQTKPFISVHCAALTETLLASELFGHEKGSFTGAHERKIGRFERADQGTLFLDEIGEIPESMQVKLLRFLQEGEFERVGSTKTIKVNVRLIAATNKKLAEEVKKGNFREDLFYRINVILIEIPSLKERHEDVKPLVKHYLDYFSKRNNKKLIQISSEALKALEAYKWPGNIRELRNVMERIVVLSSDGAIDVNNLPGDILGSGVSSETGGISQAVSGDISSMEKEMIRQKLLDLDGNKSKAAKSLGISRRTLYRKIEEYDL